MLLFEIQSVAICQTEQYMEDNEQAEEERKRKVERLNGKSLDRDKSV